jgi:hypothetical protein
MGMASSTRKVAHSNGPKEVITETVITVDTTSTSSHMERIRVSPNFQILTATASPSSRQGMRSR